MNSIKEENQVHINTHGQEVSKYLGQGEWNKSFQREKNEFYTKVQKLEWYQISMWSKCLQNFQNEILCQLISNANEHVFRHATC